MYRRPKFLEILHEIREEMSREADYDMDLFAEMVRSGEIKNGSGKKEFDLSDKSANLWSVELPDTKH